MKLEVINAAIGTEQVNAVDARSVHKKLKSKQEFAHWIKKKVLNNPYFAENVDYILLDNLDKRGAAGAAGGSNKKDYALTIDTAKKVAMAEQTKEGDKVRDYFLKCERTALAKQEQQTPGSFIEALRLAADALEAREEAIATKARIGSRREATSMNRASQAVKKANKLKQELDQSKKSASIKRMYMDVWLDVYVDPNQD